MENEDNVIQVIFDPKFYDELFLRIKFQGGVVKAEQWLLDLDMHPTFAKVAVKRIMKTRGW